MVFLNFRWSNGKTNFGSGDKVRPLQISSWGEVGDCLDAFNLDIWTDQTDEELKRAKKNLDPLQTAENI